MYDKLKLYVLAIMTAFVPLIVRVKAVDFVGIPQDQTNIVHLASGIRLNFFHYWKAVSLWVLAGVLVFILLGQLIDKRFKLKRDNKIIVALGIMIFFTMLSTYFADFRHVAVWGFFDRTEGLVTYMAYFILFLTAWSIDFSNVDLKPLKIGLMVSGTVLSLMGIFQFYGYNFLETALAYRLAVPSEYQPQMPELAFRFKNIAYATLFNPNYVGSFTAVVVPLFLGLFLFEKGKGEKILYFAFSVLAFALMVASGSRAGLVGILFASLFLMTLNRKNFKRDWKRYVAVMAVFFLVAVIMNFQNPKRVFGNINRMFTDIEKVTEEATLEGGSEDGVQYGEGLTRLGSNRGYIWPKSVKMMKDTLVAGHGPDTFIFHFPHKESFEEGFNKVVDKPHNLYLQMGINQGLVALLAFIFLNKYAFWKFLRQADQTFEKRYDQIMLVLGASLFGYLVTSLFNDSVVSVAPLYWAMLGIFLSLLLSEKEMAKAKGFDM